jgi:hypothetical protein
MVGLDQAMLYAVIPSSPIKGMAPPAGSRPSPVIGQVGELDAVVL